MALLVPGATVSVLSGKIGGTVFARNRGGAYARSYAIPTRVTSQGAQIIKAAFAAASRAYANLTTEQIQAWDQYGKENPVSNRIGQLITLKGQSWYVGVNSRLTISGDTNIDVPPILPPPVIATASNAVVDVNDTTATIDIAAHDDSENIKILVYAARSVSAGKRYVDNLYTNILVSAAGEDDWLPVKMTIRWMFPRSLKTGSAPSRPALRTTSRSLSLTRVLASCPQHSGCLLWLWIPRRNRFSPSLCYCRRPFCYGCRRLHYEVLYCGRTAHHGVKITSPETPGTHPRGGPVKPRAVFR